MGNTSESNYTGITVITCSKRSGALKNILENFNRQLYNIKELIVILHDNNIDIKTWKAVLDRYSNVKLFQLDENISLGECLNFGAAQANLDIIAKFDDDDYYGPRYLVDSIPAFEKANADVIGKATSFVYFEKYKILAIRNPNHEECYVTHIDGPSLIIKKKVFETVNFRDVSRGEDNWFCRDCLEQGLRLYSVNRFQHVYFRHSNIEDHTWTIENEKLLNWCRFIAKGPIKYEKYINSH